MKFIFEQIEKTCKMINSKDGVNQKLTCVFWIHNTDFCQKYIISHSTYKPVLPQCYTAKNGKAIQNVCYNTFSVSRLVHYSTLKSQRWK